MALVLMNTVSWMKECRYEGLVLNPKTSSVPPVMIKYPSGRPAFETLPIVWPWHDNVLDASLTRLDHGSFAVLDLLGLTLVSREATGGTHPGTVSRWPTDYQSILAVRLAAAMVKLSEQGWRK